MTLTVQNLPHGIKNVPSHTFYDLADKFLAYFYISLKGRRRRKEDVFKKATRNRLKIEILEKVIFFSSILLLILIMTLP